MVELNCETDFVARTEEFQTLAHDLAMQVTATQPQFLTREDIPPKVIETKKRTYREEMADQNKPEHILDRIVEGKLKKFYQEACLLEQPFIKDDDLTVDDLIKNAIAKIGENIVLRRFVRYQIGK